MTAIQKIEIQTIEAGLLKNSAGTFIDIFQMYLKSEPLNQERNYRFPGLESCRLFIFEKYGIEIAKVDSNS